MSQPETQRGIQRETHRTAHPPMHRPMHHSLPVVQSTHGGPDALGVPLYDFSTNSNACGPCPSALAAVQDCDPSRYPDPSYSALRAQLADFHRVDASRIVLAGSASEFIYRMTAWAHQQGAHTVGVPRYAYGDYAQAAHAWGLAVTDSADDANPATLAALASLIWACEPSSPLGQALGAWPPAAEHGHTVLDCAYVPLRLSGAPSGSDAERNQRERLWQMWTPNKALGLTGVRAAYVIAPPDSTAEVAALNRLCASWPLGAHGVALLQAWVQAEAQSWLTQSLTTLRTWKARQIGMLTGLGWTCLQSDANFFVARPWGDAVEANTTELAAALVHLRGGGIKLRDAASFGLPGHVRVGVLPPVAQDALAKAWTPWRQTV